MTLVKKSADAIIGGLLGGALIIGLLFAAHGEARECSKMCRPGVSYACGKGCTPIGNKCRKATTTACNGLPEDKPEVDGKTWFSEPKHVEPEAVSQK